MRMTPGIVRRPGLPGELGGQRVAVGRRELVVPGRGPRRGSTKCGISTVNWPSWVAVPWPRIDVEVHLGVAIGVRVTSPSRLPLNGTGSPGGARGRPARGRRRRPARGRRRNRSVSCDLSRGLRYNGGTSFPARRPCVGAVPGRWVSFFAVGTHRLFRLFQSGLGVREPGDCRPTVTSPNPTLRRPRASRPPPGRAAHPRGQGADAAVGQADQDAGGVSRRGPRRIAVALNGVGWT